MSDPVRVPPSGGPGHWRRWLLPVLASAAWLVLTFCLYRHAVQGEQAHLLELCHTRLAATAHQLMDARDWNAGHGGVYVPLSAYGEPNPWLPEKDRTLQTADGRTLVLMNPAYMSRQMAERLTEPGFRLAIVGQAPLRPGNRADDWERRILATATQGGQVFFSGEDCLPQGRLRLLRTLAAQESCLRCHQGHKEGDMLGGISISMDAAAYVRDLERKQRELGLLYGLLALTGVLAVGGITSNLTLRRLQAEEKSRLKSAFMGRLSHDMRTPLAAMLGMSDLLDRQDCGTEQRHTALAYLRRACGALLEMVDDITDHASLEQGDVRLRCRTFDLPACLRACADLYNPKTVRATMGALFRRPVWRCAPAQAKALLSAAGIPLWGAALRCDTVDARQVDYTRAAVAIGSEGRGLSEEVLALCDQTIRLPMSERCESLNAAVAAAVLLWEMYR